MAEKKNGLFVIESGDIGQPYRYAAGRHGSHFLRTISEKEKILGICCPKCKKVYVPPRAVCGPCFTKTEGWVELGTEGRIGIYTILRFKFISPETGEPKPVPYIFGTIFIDGADTALAHFISIPENRKLLRIGARVGARFTKKKNGNMADISHFEIIDKVTDDKVADRGKEA